MFISVIGIIRYYLPIEQTSDLRDCPCSGLISAGGNPQRSTKQTFSWPPKPPEGTILSV